MSLNEHITNHIIWAHNDSMSDIFSTIYDKNLWQSEESVSGKGSERAEAENILTYLPKILKKYKIQTMIDAPCGDFNWMKFLEYEFLKYTGVDIVEDLVAANEKYETQKRQFFVGNILDFEFEKSDVILCRDCFIHLQNEEIIAAIENFKRSGSTYLLANSYDLSQNTDVITGQFRGVNLLIKPFNFPQPLEIIVEDEKDGKLLCLWRLADL